MGAMGLVLLLLVLSGGSVYGGTHWVNSFAGPFIGYVQKIYRCPNVDYSDHLAYYHLRPSYYKPHFRGLQTMTGNASVLMDLKDEDAWGFMKMDTWANNQWKENAFHFKFSSNLCSSLRMHVPSLWLEFYPPSSLKGPCVIHKGFWTFDHKPVNWTYPHIPIMPYGKWRVEVRMGLQGSDTPRCCMMGEVVTAPRIDW